MWLISRGIIVFAPILFGTDAIIGRSRTDQSVRNSPGGLSTGRRFISGELLEKAAEAGLKVPNRRHISSLENGHQEPGLEYVFNLARAIGLRPSAMLRKLEDKLLPSSERERMDRAARTPRGQDTRRGRKSGPAKARRTR